MQSSVIFRISEVTKGLKKLREALGPQSANLDRGLFRAGLRIRDACVDELNAVVYDTPPSPSYQRTGFLRASIYVTTAKTNNYADARAYAESLAMAVVDDPEELEQYQMMHFIPYTGGRGVRVTAGAIYAMDVEVGNNPRGPRPFMRAGIDAGQRDAMQEIMYACNATLAQITPVHVVVS